MNINPSLFVALLLSFAALAALPACNTISGAGQDIGAAGEAIESTAEDAAD